MKEGMFYAPHQGKKKIETTIVVIIVIIYRLSEYKVAAQAFCFQVF